VTALAQIAAVRATGPTASPSFVLDSNFYLGGGHRYVATDPALSEVGKLLPCQLTEKSAGRSALFSTSSAMEPFVFWKATVSRF